MRPPYPPNPKGKQPKRFQAPSVNFQPQSGRGIRDGVNHIADLVKPTLGPLPHLVLNEQPNRGKPEFLDNAATIARRIIQLPGRDRDVGAMFIRHLLWKLQESEGDGTATAAVIFQSIYNQGVRYIAAGGNPMILRQKFDQVVPSILEQIDQMKQPIQGKSALSGLARTIGYDDDLGRMLGEIFDIIGAYGRLEVRKGSGRELVREYIEGVYYEQGLFSRQMSNQPGAPRVEFQNPGIIISDLNIDEPEQFVPLLTLALRQGLKQLLVLSPQVSDRAMAMVLSKTNREKIEVALVRTPGLSSDVRVGALQDIAILTGARPLLKASGDTLDSIRLENLGKARRVWADMEAFGIIGGRGNPRELRSHIANLRQSFQRISDPDERNRLIERLGKLMGGAAALYVGGLSPTDIEARVELAKRTANAMRGAIRDGVLPGGGAALLACRSSLMQKAQAATDEVDRLVYRMVARAFEEPTRVLLSNAGYDSSAILGHILAQIEANGPGYGFDVTSRQVVDMNRSGIFDSASVVKGAVRSAISGVALLLTTDIIIHSKNPPELLNT